MSWDKLFSLPIWPKKISNTPKCVIPPLAYANAFFVSLFGWAPLGSGILEFINFVGQEIDEAELAETYRLYTGDWSSHSTHQRVSQCWWNVTKLVRRAIKRN